MSRYHAGLIIIAFLFGSCATEAASPNTSMQAACAGDRQRLCSAFVGNQNDMQRCMSAHRSEWSSRCQAAAETQTGPGPDKTPKAPGRCHPGDNNIGRCKGVY